MLASCTFAGSELRVTGEVRYLPDGRSSGEKWWHLLALSCGSGGREDSIFLLLSVCPSSFSLHLNLNPSFIPRTQPKPKKGRANPRFFQIQREKKKRKKKLSFCLPLRSSASPTRLPLWACRHVHRFPFSGCIMHDAQLDTSGKAEAACETALHLH